MRFRQRLIGAIIIGGTAITCAPALPAVEFNDATLKLLKSSLREDRQRFYVLIPNLTPEEVPLAVKQLQAAWDFHKQPVIRIVMDATRGQNTWTQFLKAHAEWRAAVEPLSKDIQTDLHKDPKKVAKLTHDMEQCARLRDHVRLAANTTEAADFNGSPPRARRSWSLMSRSPRPPTRTGPDRPIPPKHSCAPSPIPPT